MKTKVLSLFIIVLSLQNSALAQEYAQPYAPDASVLYGPQAEELPNSWGMTQEDADMVYHPTGGARKGFPSNNWGVYSYVYENGKKYVAVHARELRNVGKMETARVTFYNPTSKRKIEGGKSTRHSVDEKVHAIEWASKTGRPVTIAADYLNEFGEACNQTDSRCTLLIRMAGFDRRFPAYRKKFKYLPKNTFIAIVEDTGGAFVGTNGKRFDLSSISSELEHGVPGWLAKKVYYIQLKSPCGMDEGARYCNYEAAYISEQTKTAMSTGGRSL